MNLFTLAWRNLERRRFRTLLTICGLAISVAVVVALVGIAESLQTSFLALYERRGADLVVQRRSGAVQLSKGIPLELATKIREMPEAEEVIAGLMDMVAFEDAGLFMVIINGWEPDCPVLDRVTIKSGRRLVAGDQQQVMLGRILAENLGKKAGDSVEIYSQPFEVVGVFESFSVYENGAAFMLMEQLQRQMDRPGQATGFVVQARDHGNRDAIATLRRQIEALDPEIAAIPCAEFVANLSQIRVARSMSWVISIVAAIIGAIGVLNTMVISVLERRIEIGALRAIGWTRRRVMQMIFAESAILSAGGIVLGIASGTCAMLAVSRWHVTANLVQGDLSLHAWFQGAMLAIVMALVGSAYPAYRGATASPATAMRG